MGHPGDRNGRLGVDEVAGQQQTELLDLVNPVRAGERVHRVLLVSSQHVGVVAGFVGGGQVTGQGTLTLRSISSCSSEFRRTRTRRVSALP